MEALLALRTRQRSGEKSLPWPLYRWTIHGTARTRDVIGAQSIVFRPLYQTLTSSEGEIADLLEDQIFYLYRKEDLKSIPDQTTLGASTDSPQSWAQIRKWLDICTDTHAQCQLKQTTSSPLPTRLLDVGEIDPDAGDDQTGHMRLVITEKQGITGPYTTLSHSWGKGRAFITVNATNQAAMMQTGMQLGDSRLTRNFREAIRVTRKLKIRYLWMDSICILQQDKSDFAIEAPRMHIYYRHSYCNIAAADSKDPDQGLFRQRRSRDGLYQSIPARFESTRDNKIFGDASWYIIAGDLWKRELLAEPLYRRGWVFQERMLAPRIIHFAKDQIFFECAEMTACETLPAGFARGVDTRAATDRYWRQRLHHNLLAKDRPLHGTAEISIEELWKTSVSTYTRCELTNGSDKLVAISGVATLVSEILDEAYGEGLWEKTLEEQLAWRVVDSCQADGTPSKRPEYPRCPSWSWASVDGIIELQDRLTDREYRVTNHEGNPIKFEIEAHHIEAAAPSILTHNPSTILDSMTVGSTSAGSTTAKSTSSNGIALAHQDKLMKLSSIKISAYLRSGQTHFISSSKTWMLRIFKNADENESDALDIVKVSFDEAPKNYLMTCVFLVLAYSRNTPAAAIDSEFVGCPSELGSDVEDTIEKQSALPENEEDSVSDNEVLPTFSGIGLVIDEIIPDHYCRLGSFTFDNLFEESLARLVVVKGDEKGQETPKDIYLH